MRIYSILLFGLFFIMGCITPTIQAKAPYVVKSIKDFGAKGNGVANDHNAFVQAASFFNARNGNGKLVIPNGTYIVGQQTRKQGIYKGQNVFTLKGASNFKIEGGSNSIIKYKDDVRYGTFLPYTNKPYSSTDKIVRKSEYLSTVGNCFYFNNCRNIELSGLQINGNADNAIKGGRYGDKGIQAPYSGVSIRDGNTLTIENCKVINFGLDGIYISTTANSTVRNDIMVNNTVCEYNGRQGLSIVGATGVQVNNSKFNYTGKGKLGSNPKAGIDIEPNKGSKARDIIITNCEMVDNAGVAFISMNGDARNVKLNNCLLIGTNNWSSWVQKPQFTFTNCKFYGSIVHGFNAKNNLDRTKYINCYFADTTFKTRGAYLAELSSGYNQLFQDCIFKSNAKKVIYHRNSAPTKNLYTTFRNCSFWVNTSKFGAKAYLGIIGKARLENNTFAMSESKTNKNGKYFRFENVVGKATNIEKFGLKKD